MRRFAPVVAFLLLLALPACTSDPEPEDAGPTTLTVLLDHDVTAEQKSAVEQRLRAMPSVQGVALTHRSPRRSNS